MIVLVAPYTGYNKSGEVHLGASKKIRFVISVLAKIDSEILLVNSAHNSIEKKSFEKRKITIDDYDLTEIILPTNNIKSRGKLLNLLHIKEAIKIIDDEKKSPSLFWFYNAYAFEMLFAQQAFKHFKKPMVLEFEDWHFSRDRGFHLKPWFDFFAWRSSVRLFAKVYAINSNVQQKNQKFCQDVSILPGVVPNDLVEICRKSDPFKVKDTINIGYFGGLKVEKGADIVLSITKRLPEGYAMHVTGTGTLANDFTKLQRSNANLTYYGMVSDQDLLDIISKCDIIINPHVPIAELNDGLFPFKVIEAIASGRLLISTELSFNGFEEIAAGVKFVDHSDTAFLNAIVESRQWYEQKSLLIKESASKAVELFGETSIKDDLITLIANSRKSSN